MRPSSSCQSRTIRKPRYAVFVKASDRMLLLVASQVRKGPLAYYGRLVN